MTPTEIENGHLAFCKIQKFFQCRYPVTQLGNQKCFLAPNGYFFRLFEFPGDYALAIEYAETEDDAKRNRFEDGDRFYLSELSEDELFHAMINEIEG